MFEFKIIDKVCLPNVANKCGQEGTERYRCFHFEVKSLLCVVVFVKLIGKASLLLITDPFLFASV